MSIRISLYFLLSVVITACVSACRPVVPVPDPEPPYRLPNEHLDNSNPLKAGFFQERFVDLNGEPMCLDDLRGTPVIVMMFPVFRTEEGRSGLLGVEQLVRERGGQFQALVIPFDDPETVRSAITSEIEGLSFLFRADGSENHTLVKRYSDFFWDKDIIAVDFPLDPVTMHQAAPFYWVVDRSGRIREKLIVYSIDEGVRPVDLAQVMDALLGPVIVEPDTEEPAEMAEGEEIVDGEESSG